jgi:hypothetical protein
VSSTAAEQASSAVSIASTRIVDGYSKNDAILARRYNIIPSLLGRVAHAEAIAERESGGD